MRQRRAVHASTLRVVLVVMLLAGALSACGHSTLAPSRTTSSASAVASTPASSRSGGSLTDGDVATAEHFTRTVDGLDLPMREYVLTGSWHLPDTTDRVAALRRNTGERQQVWLMRLAEGRMQRVLLGATQSAAGFTIGSIRISDTWLAWEEVGPGDDLRQTVEWRLYAAPIRGLRALGDPRLITSASSATASRPLFDVAGSRVVWTSTGRDELGERKASHIVRYDLDSERGKVVYTTENLLESLSLKNGCVLVSETDAARPALTSLQVLDLATGEKVDALQVPSAHLLSHWPAWQKGWFAWTPFAAGEDTYPALYVASGNGDVFAEGSWGVDPCFVGDYMFFQTQRFDPRRGARTVEVRALRLRDMTTFVVDSGSPDENEWWQALVGAPDLRRTYVTIADRSLFAESAADAQTVVRIYDVR